MQDLVLQAQELVALGWVEIHTQARTINKVCIIVWKFCI